jgi:UDP-galactopyranose mutase
MTITAAENSPVLVAGAGLSGATLARVLAEAGERVRVLDPRPHVAGNCHTERDAQTGVLLHRYGPHIFHTDDSEVRDFITRFGRFVAYAHRVFSTVGGRVYALPVNLHTINQLFERAMGPDEARAFITARASAIAEPQNFEEQALAMIGPELYAAFFKGYTQKQWGCDPRDLPASILKRLPLRFSYDARYFNHQFQAIPEQGYTPVVAAMLDHPNITVELNRAVDPADPTPRQHLFWTGPLDGYFNYRLGRLGYRTLDFEHERLEGDFQGCPVMNYGEEGVPYTRITEHKHFAPWESHDQTLITREYARPCGVDDIPYYPIRLAQEKSLLSEYRRAAQATPGVTFLGRLGSYRYLDMDVCIREALDAARAYLEARAQGRALPALLSEEA